MLRRFPLLEFFACRAGFCFEFQVLDDMLWRLCDHVADIVKTFTACAACNLVKVASGQNGGLVTAVLAELREKHCADRNVYAHAERVCAANDLEQTLLGELFAKNAVLWQKPRVVKPNALLEPTLDIRTIRACKTDFLNRFVDLDFFFLGAEVKTHEVLRIACRSGLREVDDVNRSLSLVHKLLHFG